MQTKTVKLLLAAVFMSIIFAVFTISYIINMKVNIEDSVLRLHIIGASDTVLDQKLKLCVRDRILSDFSSALSDCSSVSDSKKIVLQNIEQIKSAAEDELRKRGCCYTVTANIEECGFPTKKYGSIILPAGRYSALNIRIGPAMGQNWWCVMYPPLCITDTSVEISEKSKEKLKNILSYEEYKLICDSESSDIKIKFKIAEIIGKYFR